MDAGWERWLGGAYRPGAYECADFAMDVLREDFGVLVHLPRGDGPRGRDRLVREMIGTLAAKVDVPRAGDGVLMRAAGRVRGVGSHIGIWVAGRVLHNIADAGVCSHALADLPLVGLEFKGFYRWITSCAAVR